jgi:hypothetical protein
MVSETHSLNSLKKKNLPELLEAIPMEKLEQIVESLQDNKNNKDETVSDSQH